ncbi:pyridine nucleotide-disulfide oxidoreductase domain-containing protein 2-like [Pecten maximus]|uniref:pyridine nucleotide-disulfide oxidoreductase domain-containing protein 2-like n=1 Tax=Pecten maximus TaxID=6579 RepID=UPI00145903B2|nr:pyridine nucleotide-disulfide oxidoreductase domain-containing protein 2-like [Pecten maximus]
MAFRGKLNVIYGTIYNSAIRNWRQPNCKYSTTCTVKSKSDLKSKYDVIIVGAGHNGLVSAAYLQEAGLSVCVLERRHIIGGAAVTEEIIPGFKFSRASYVLSLLRPKIVQDLELKKYGLEVYLRDPSSYTPLLKPGGRDGKARSLLLHRDSKKTAESIAQFSQKDAKNWFEYEKQLEHIVSAIEPLMDTAPVHLPSVMANNIRDQLKSLPAIFTLLKSFKSLGKETDAFYELMTAPTTKILDKWFESEPLKATLATDSVIGAMISPKTPGSGYVLLHHVMGELEGVKGAWGIVKGGMGAVSQSIANCAVDRGASIFTEAPVQEILTSDNSVKGVLLQDGTAIEAKAVLSNATPKVTYLDLLPEGNLPEDLMTEIRNFDYTSPVTKINVALKELPNFVADPNIRKNEVMPHHRATIHLNCEHSDLIHDGFLDAQAGRFSSKPMIEMVIPTSLDPTMAPPGCHVCLLFTQYTPYHLADGQEWDDHNRNKYADTVFDDIERYAPGFKASVVGRDILTPPDLEKTFNLTGGNIFHGTMGLDQLYMSRPTTRLSNYTSPVRGLYLCGSGAHPGGGVMGSAGRLAAMATLSHFKKKYVKQNSKK